jgi:hypothetical protein
VVRLSPRTSSATMIPLDTAVKWAGTVAMTSLVAFSLGESTHGNQNRESSSCPWVHTCTGLSG